MISYTQLAYCIIKKPYHLDMHTQHSVHLDTDSKHCLYIFRYPQMCLRSKIAFWLNKAEGLPGSLCTL